MITLIGTGHVFDLTQPLLNIFDEKQPDVLCIELDKDRYQALMMKKNDPEAYRKASKNQPIVYKLLARFQNNLAKEYGVQAGQEMITTSDYAQSHQIPLAFIDMNAQNLFSRMLKEMTIREKIKIALSGFTGFFMNKKKVEKELDKIQGEFDSYIGEIGKKFPTIKRILIDERNRYMIQQLKTANEEYEKVIAVVGDGHIPGLAEMLKKQKIDFEIIRLKELREKKSVADNSSTASFTIEHKDF
jgi:pheromone shutdown protein TraB